MTSHRFTCDIAGCDAEVKDLTSPVAICAWHGFQVYAHWVERHRKAAEPERIRRNEADQAARERRGDGSPVVYYVSMPGDLIKIGTTTNLAQRLHGLTLLPDSVLAAEPGGRDLEQQRHRQFAHLRMRRTERFRDAPELRAHIDQLIRQHGRPVVRRLGQAVAFDMSVVTPSHRA